MRAASLTVRHIGPTRVLRPRWIMPEALASSRVGTTPTTSLNEAGLTIEPPVSSPIAHVTKFIETDVAEPPLEPPGSRVVSYGLHSVPPNELRAAPPAYSSRFALARMIAPALRRRSTTVASLGGRSLAQATSPPEVLRMSTVSYWSLIAITTPWSGRSLPVRAKSASSCAALSSASGSAGSLSVASVMLRALRSSKPHARRFAGRRLSVISALTLPAFGIIEIGPRMPCGWLTQVPL
jgi:hypothetical protein